MRIAVVGASGFAGAEAMRWTLLHPGLELVIATSGAEAGRLVSELYPALSGLTGLRFSDLDAAHIAESADAALLAVPHTAALALVPALLEAGLIVIDLSADFRLTDPSVYEEWYGVEHTASDLLPDAVYGLPELDRSRLPGARLIACPGCYPTASTLAALPALKAGLWDGSRIVVDAKSGVSGAGRTASPTTHFVSANESVSPYKVGTHRHTPEMEQAFAAAAGRSAQVLFTPHLVPMTRGLLSTVYISMADGITTLDVEDAYRRTYASEPFVRLHERGVMPGTSEVRGAAGAAVGFQVDERTRTIVAVCAIDNLGKGAAAQGIQCLNAAAGIPESEGLLLPGPVV